MVEKAVALMRLGGRANRAAYWETVVLGYFCLAVLLLGLVFLTVAPTKGQLSDYAVPGEMSAWVLGANFLVGAAYALCIMFAAYVLWIILAATIRRLHDRDRTAGWIILLVIVPLVPFLRPAVEIWTGQHGPMTEPQKVLTLIEFGLGIWGFIEIWCLAGTSGSNSFGADPLARKRFNPPLTEANQANPRWTLGGAMSTARLLIVGLIVFGIAFVPRIEGMLPSGLTAKVVLLFSTIIALWLPECAARWFYRGFRSSAHALSGGSFAHAAHTTVEPLLQEPDGTRWWATALIAIAGGAGATALASGLADVNLAFQIGSLVGSATVVALLAVIVYLFAPKRTSLTRSTFQFATACVFSGVVLSNGFNDYSRAEADRAELAPLTPVLSAMLDKATAPSITQTPSAQESGARKAAHTEHWASSIQSIMDKYIQAQDALTSKWEREVTKLHFESMLTPENLLSANGRRNNRERLIKFEKLLRDYTADDERLARDYRSDFFAVYLPPKQRDELVRGFEDGFAKSRKETNAYYAKLRRIELDLSNGIKSITDLFEQEQNAVRLDSDKETLLFERDAAAEQYDALVSRMSALEMEEESLNAITETQRQKKVDHLRATLRDLQ